jgi:hypothetical protein
VKSILFTFDSTHHRDHSQVWIKKEKEVDDFVCIVTTKCNFFAATV